MWLENENIRLRALEPEDIDLLYAWENNTDLWTYGSSISPFSRFALRQYILDAQQQDIYQSRQLRLMIETKDEKKKHIVVGAVDLYEYDPFNNRAGIGILIDPASQGKKYAIQSLVLMEEYAFDFLGIHQLFAYIAVSNEKSYNLFQNSGYQMVGTLKEWKREGDEYVDIYLMQLLRNGKSK
ncbi:MAG: family acetyltransferase [Bacteroidetes bacterium]|nr:family acetyltransferase [Bacteroidota bacterium]